MTLEAPSQDFVVLTNHGGRDSAVVDLRLVSAIEVTQGHYRVHFGDTWWAAAKEDHEGLIERWVSARDRAVIGTVYRDR